MHMNCTCMKRYRGRKEIECIYVLAMGAYREDTNNIEVISIRGSKILGDAPRIFLLHVDCVLRTLPGVLPLLPSPFANMLDLLQGRTSLKQLLPLAVHYT